MKPPNDDYILALANVISFLCIHGHAFDVVNVVVDSHAHAMIILQGPPQGATMLGWEWEESWDRWQHTTSSGIVIRAFKGV